MNAPYSSCSPLACKKQRSESVHCLGCSKLCAQWGKQSSHDGTTRACWDTGNNAGRWNRNVGCVAWRDACQAAEAGISRETLESIGSDPTMVLILKACKMDQPLPDAAKVALVDRDIAFFNDKGNLVLTEAGKTFFEDLFSQRSSEN